MAHYDIGSPKSFSSDTEIRNLGNFDRGVVLCRYDRELEDGQSPYIKNMIFDKNILRTRFGQRFTGTNIATEGNLHSQYEKKFFGSFIFHIGTRIYAFDGTDTRIIYEEMPDCRSFMFEMDSVLYVFCSEVRIFTVSKTFEVSEYIFKDTKVMTNARYDLSSYSGGEIPDNMILHRLSVDYLEKETGTDYYILPTECDETVPIIFTSIETGNILTPEYTVSGARIHLTKNKFALSVNISYIPKKDTKYRNFEKIFGCTSVCTYGGNSADGTRVFFTGNDEYPGYYFYSELLSPLCVRTLSYDIIGDGNEKVSCFAKQKGELVAFCENSIHKLRYTFDEQLGANFVLSDISTGIGCDIPGSVRLIDNRLVFAKKGLGIFIIVASEYTDELSVRRISGNINGNSGEGFLFENQDDVGRSVSSDFAGKYMLVCPSGNAYVWDYGNSPYVVYDSPLVSEKKLSWYYFDGIYARALFENGTVLFCVTDINGRTEFVLFDENEPYDFGNDILCIYNCREIYVGNNFRKKIAKEISLGAVGENGTNIMIYVLADGVPIMYENYTFNERDEEGEKLRRLIYGIPGYAAYRFSIMLICSSGNVGLYDGAMKIGNAGKY